MRDLTPDELALAPDWATHYFAENDVLVCFESKDFFVWLADGVLREAVPNFVGIDEDSVKIPTKPFDITQHDWSDTSIENISYDEFCICLESSEYQNSINRNDAIAIAKHFKLTVEDLK